MIAAVDDDRVQRAVELPVATGVEPVATDAPQEVWLSLRRARRRRRQSGIFEPTPETGTAATVREVSVAGNRERD
jgi:hypothetical protein